MLVLRMKAKDGPIHLLDKDTGERFGEVFYLGGDKGEIRIGFEMEDFITILRDIPFQREHNNG